MKSNALAVVLTIVFAASNTVAQTNNPPATPPPDEKKETQARPEKQDPGVRKLSKRERRDRIKALPEKYRQFLTDVEPIIQQNEVDAFLSLETDPQREIYIRDFWRRRDQAQGTSNLAFHDLYYERLMHAKENFKSASSDRSRIYLIYGAPAGVIKTDCQRLLQPLEIWAYARIPGLGQNVRFLFYVPRNSIDYKLWVPVSTGMSPLSDLLAPDAIATAMTDEAAVGRVFLESESPYSTFTMIQTRCQNGDEILRSIEQIRQNRVEMMSVFEPPPVNPEDARKILRSVVLSDPSAPKLVAEFSVRYPAKQGSKTDAEMTLLVPKAQLQPNVVGESSTYSLDVVGEVLRDEQLYENFRYRFDFPGDVKDEKLPLILDRFLRPGEYMARIKIVDTKSNAQTVLETPLAVPEIFTAPEVQAQKVEASETVTKLREAITSSGTTLRIVPLTEEMVSGLQKIETFAIGESIKAVEFYLDGKKVAIKRQPPYSLELDFGTMPNPRRVRAVALDGNGKPLTGDEVVVNTGTDPFRVRIVSPRVALDLKGPTRVEMSVKVPDGKALQHIELFLNEHRVATLYDPPFIQTVNIPETAGVGYLRAVATLREDPAPPVEDVVMINTPLFMEEVNVHLVELPTTVVAGGKPVTGLPETAFKVLDDGQPVKVSKFEYVQNLPLSIGMAVDTSGSMQPRISETQKAGALFLQNVMRKGDRGFLVAFDAQPQMVQKWSPRLGDMTAGLSKLRAEDYTSLYDAIVFALYNFLGVKGQKALVLLTDGRDTASKFSFDQALEYARRAAVPIYAIGIGIRSTDVDVRFKLQKFCAETGGSTYYIESAEDLGRIYTDIQNELRSQYVLGFYPPQGVKPGKWREISVQVSEGKAKTIRGYYP